MMKKPRLVPYARRWYRMASIRAMSAQAAFLVAWASLPSEFKEVIPRWMMVVGALILISAGVVGALVVQERVTNDVNR